MDGVVVAKHKSGRKKVNKENVEPAISSKVKASQVDVKGTSMEAHKKVKTMEKNGKDVTADVQKRHGQTLLTEQAVKNRRLVAEAPRPPVAMLATKSALGLYKGKIVQSKIGSIWKSSATLEGVAPKPTTAPSMPKTQVQRVEKLTKTRSKSVADMPKCGILKSVPVVSKTAVEGAARLSKVPVTRHQNTGSYSARAPTRTVPSTLSGTASRNTIVVPTKQSGINNTKAKVKGTNKEVIKPPVSSTISQYRVTMETAGERRAKLAEWLASKGKTLKRPATVVAGPPKAKVAEKAVVCLKSQPKPAANASEAEPRVEAPKPNSSDHCSDIKPANVMVHGTTPMIMNTTLELLENSDEDLSDTVDDIVVNLCDALEAMVPPSRCEEDGKSNGDKEVRTETPENCTKQSDVEDVTEEEKEQNVEKDHEDVANMLEMEGASVVKYSVKTTPYLQSVKKAIEEEASTSTSRRKSNIKDVKFLTPVRRSCRIEGKSFHLPKMLLDHDPCVSSLSELVKLDEDANAYVYRKNRALVQDLSGKNPV
ncbi:cytoskeleton-associated protein 2 [Thalassophryne amazonica]|uniref:cytoskeleton-associated protein 2 n=1 Tax=Thalassophryne amazonica TaxID=390379 RepID=UPI001471AB56|nr:cytoskeleton-associated protein 2 [Thalassophryne amazonica]XP_034034872.1 cytoskeleton-associated protein 2 [Thalassophryne amazonica]